MIQLFYQSLRLLLSIVKLFQTPFKKLLTGALLKASHLTPDKYELLHFSWYRADQDPNSTSSVVAGLIIISENTERPYLRWLGILFNKKLTFKWHVKEMASKALTVANALRSLGNTVWEIKSYLL